jgi:hypothetical protein
VTLTRLLTFHVTNPMTIFRCVRRSEGSVQVRGPLFRFATCYVLTVRSYLLAQPPSWRTTPRRLSATAYSIHSQLPFISGGRRLYPQPEEAPCPGDTGPFFTAYTTGEYRFSGIGELQAVLNIIVH